MVEIAGINIDRFFSPEEVNRNLPEYARRIQQLAAGSGVSDLVNGGINLVFGIGSMFDSLWTSLLRGAFGLARANFFEESEQAVQGMMANMQVGGAIDRALASLNLSGSTVTSIREICQEVVQDSVGLFASDDPAAFARNMQTLHRRLTDAIYQELVRTQSRSPADETRLAQQAAAMASAIVGVPEDILASENAATYIGQIPISRNIPAGYTGARLTGIAAMLWDVVHDPDGPAHNRSPDFRVPALSITPPSTETSSTPPAPPPDADTARDARGAAPDTPVTGGDDTPGPEEGSPPTTPPQPVVFGTIPSLPPTA